MSNYYSLIDGGLASKAIAIYKMSDGSDSLGLFPATVGSSVIFSTTNAVDGLAAQFNGFSADSSFTIPDNNAFSFTDGTTDKPFALKFNLNFLPTTPSLSPIFARWSGANNNTSEYLIYLRSTKVAVLLFNKTAGGVYIGAETTLVLSSNTPYNIIINYSGSGLWTGIKIYVNGVLQTLNPLNSGSGYTSMGNTGLATTVSFANTSRLRGTIDELYPFNAELDSSEIATLQTNYYPNI
jgi:hypothetical protein